MMLKNSFFATLLLLTMVACDKNRVFEENKKINDGIWKAEEPVKFEVDVTDTVSLHNFYVNVRHTTQYAFSNLFLFIRTDFPNGKAARDTLECLLQDRMGHWVGSGLGDIVDARIGFKNRVRFPLSGKYTFTFEQAMRAPALPMVLEMGLRIEKDAADNK